MKICFSFENLYPAATRAGRHIETLVRRFQDRGHEVFVVTTPVEQPVEPEGIEILRLREMPGLKGHVRSDTLLGKAISKFVKQFEIQAHFAEGLTPLSAVTVKSAHRAGAKTIIRVLADADGIVHSIGQDRKLAPSALKKRISTMLGYVDAAASSSDRCTELLRDHYDGSIQVVEKCIDLSICNPDRVQDLDRDTFREKYDVVGRPAIIYSREQIRAETIINTIPLIRELADRIEGIAFLVAGEIDERARVVSELAEAGIQDAYRLCDTLSQRDLFAAYSISDIYLAPHDSRASESELLEAMAMRSAVVCFGTKAETVPALVAKTGALVLDDDGDGEAAANRIFELLSDESRLREMREKAREVAESMDIGVGVDRVQHLCEGLLGLPLTDFSADPDTAQDVEPAPADAEFGVIHGEEFDDQDTPTAADEDLPIDDDEARFESPDAEDATEETRDGFDDESEPDLVDDQDGESPAREDEDGEAGGRKKRRRRRSRRRLRHEEEDEPEQSDNEGEREGEGEEVEPSESAESAPSEAQLLDEAGKRLRELDPKLTLRDLMPFLRPPKQIFVMSMASGTGQHRAGEAIFEAFKTVDQNLKVRQINIAEYLDRDQGPGDVERMLAELRQDPSFFGSPFETEAPRVDEESEGDDESEVESNEPAGSDLSGLLSRRMKSLILDKRPHQIVLTHFLPLKLIAELKKEHELRTKICVVVTDHDLHPYWMAEGVDQYLVPTEKVRFKMLRAGVEPSCIDVVGIPVHPRFEQESNRDDLRRSLGLKPNLPTILLRPAGIGSNEQIVESIRQILNVGYPFNLLVLTGRNEPLAGAVKELEVPRGATVSAFGFVNNIHEVMSASDLMITRAVGHTVAEAFASGLPMLLLRPTPGIEDRTADWFVEQGFALKAHDALDLEWLVTDLLRNQGRGLRHMRDAAMNGGRPRSGAAGLSVEKIRRQLH